MTPSRGLLPPVAAGREPLRPPTPARGAVPVLTPPRGVVPAAGDLVSPARAGSATALAEEPGEGGTPAKRRVAPAVFTVLSLALAPLVAAIAVLLLPAGSANDPNNRPVIQVLPRPTTTVSPAPAGQATDDPGTLVER
jgi:hypothetical protein